MTQCWTIPPEKNAEFVARMEDVLGMYAMPYDPMCPLIVMDELCEASHNSSNVECLVM